MKTTIIQLTCFLLFTSFYSFSQVVGGRTNSEQSPKVSEATKLTGGGFTGDVNHMTGEYQGSIPLGTVSTPAGLSFSLSLNYTSSFSFSTNQPMTEGIPFGDGWSPNIPTISIETDVFHRYSKHLECEEENTFDSTSINNTSSPFAAEDEGDLYWFSPMVSIPGVGSGRAVFKYIDVSDNKCAVFVLNKFETPVEIRYYGDSWTVKVADGTVYHFGTHLANYRAPSNKRQMYYDHNDITGSDLNEAGNSMISGTYSNPEKIRNAIEPKLSYSVWHCDLIYNQNYPLQGIRFEYEKYGAFNYFKEFQQSRYDMVHPSLFNSTTLPYLPDYTAYTDVFLKEVRSYVMESSLDILELEYDVVNSLSGGLVLNPNDAGVTAVDNLYSSEVVYTLGSGGDQFQNWARYKHKAGGLNLITNESNPYVDGSGYYREQITSGNEIAFDHSFLESGFLPYNMFRPGDIYEIRTKITRPSGEALNNGNGTVDIALVTKNSSTATSIGNYSGPMTESTFNATRGNEIFSTFNMALKWQMGWQQSVLQTSNLFVMPNVPSSFDGFYIQVGPGNSDIDYSYNGIELDNMTGIPNALNCYPAKYGERQIKSGATIPSNFGTGHPWSMMVPIYAKMALQSGSLTGSPGTVSDLFETWYRSAPPPAQNFVNVPTKFDNTVELQEVQIVRYSKNTYMLTGVKQYRINGEYSFDVPVGVIPPDGKKLILQKCLEYENHLVGLIENLDYGPEVNVDTNNVHLRNIILLKSVTEVPINGDLYALNFNLADPSIVLKTTLKYSKIISSNNSMDLTFNPQKPYAGLNKYLLTEYIDHLGGITKLIYYPAGSKESRVSFNNESRSGCGEMFDRKPFGTDRSYTMHMAVRFLMKNDEDDQLNPQVTQPSGYVANPQQLKRWEYVYNIDSIIVNPQEYVLRPPSSDQPAHFRSNFHMDIEMAFSDIRVYEPGLWDATSNQFLRNYTDYKYYGETVNFQSYPADFPTIDNYLYYGKLKSAKTYDHNGVLHEERIISYGKTLAFENGYKRPNFYREQLGYDDLLVRNYEYKDYYLNESSNIFAYYIEPIDTVNGVIIVDTVGSYIVAGADANYINALSTFSGKNNGIMEGPKFLEFFFFEMLQANNPPYMFDSYFVKKTSEIVRTYEKGLSKNPDVIIPDIPASVSKGDNPFGTGVENPVTYDPERDIPIKTAIYEQKNDYIPQLIIQSPLSDSVLYELIAEKGIDSDKKADVLAIQNGMSNDVWKQLIYKMKEFPPLSIEKVISTQPYFSDEILFYLIDHSDRNTDDKVYQKTLIKNPYLSDTVVKRMIGAQQIPGESFGEVISKQTQFTEDMLSEIISSANLRDAQLVNVLKNQLMTDALYLQILNDIKFSEPSIVQLMEQTIAYPSDVVLIAILNKTPLYTSESMRRILAVADREIGSDVLSLVDQKYPPREAIKIKPPLFNGNPLNKYCQNQIFSSRTYIENKTEYEYYEADYLGFAVGKPYELLMGQISSIDQASAFPKTVELSDYGFGTGTREIGGLRLKHEPSWQVFSIKTSSPHLPEAYNRQEFFYWYDLQNRYDRYWYNFNFDAQITNLDIGIHSYSTELTDTLVTNLNWHADFQNQGGVPILPHIDGMERSRTYGNRVIAFQKSVFSKNTREVKPLMQSEYFDYDRRWKFDDLPLLAETQYYEGPACTNPPPPPGCQDLYDCTDCYYFKYTTDEAMLALVPLNHCAWLIPGVGRVICPSGQSPLGYYPNASELYCNTGITDGGKAMQQSAVLAKTLMLRSVIIQLDTIHNTQDNDFYDKRLDTKNKYVVDFYMGGSEEEDAGGFSNPIKMLMPYDNLNVRTILERNRYLQPELEKNQVDLKTRYYYNRSENIWNVNSTCPTEGSYSTIVNTNIGLPVRITVGYDRIIEGDSLVTQYEYNSIGMVSKVTEPSGKFTEYTFDDFWRLTGVEENGNRLLMNNEYHMWDKNNTLKFNEKTNQNYVLNRIYNGADLNNDVNTEYRKGFVDPLGREHSTIQAYRSGDNYYQIHSGTLNRDNWSRTTSAHKNHLQTINLGDPLQTPLQMTNNMNLAYSGIIYEDDPKSRAKRTSNFGVDVNDIHVVRSDYAIANYIFTSCELGLNYTELQLIMGPGNTSNYRFYRTETFDQDNKVTVEYTNAMGQKVGTLSYSENNVKIVTLFVYDSYGNLTRVINPEKQHSNYKYNMLGQLVKEITVDAGTKAYMYNKQGMVSVMQDEVANNFTEAGVSKPYFRVFKYDDFGRLIETGRTDQFESTNTYPIYNSNYHPLLYETTFVGLGPDQPTNIAGQEFYFDYVFTNISTQDWLANYKGMVTMNIGGGIWDQVPGTISVVSSQLIHIDLLEKKTIYGSDALVSNIGKIIETNSFNNEGKMIQRISYEYDVNDNLAQQIIQFHPDQDLTFNPSGAMTSVITYPSYNYRNSVLEQKADVDNDGTVDIHYFYEYDALNRLKAVHAASGEVSDISGATKLVSYVYSDNVTMQDPNANASGLLIKKIQHSGIPDSDIAAIIDYSFDTRDRLTNILATHADFSFMDYDLFYDNNSPMFFNGITQTVNHHQNWNGNINGTLMSYDFSGLTISNNSFDEPTLYGFKYDRINRLTEADATVGDFIVSGTPTEVTDSYRIGDESMSYDKIGNIKTMLRVLKNVQVPPSSSYIAFDHFNYNYQAGNNRLTSVTGLSGSQSRSYEYDENGNLLIDTYKGITSTTVGRAAYTYNMVKNGEEISYLYSMGDQRIYKKVVTSSGTTEEYYLMDGLGKTIAIKNMQDNTWEYFVSAAEREARLKPNDDKPTFMPGEIQFFIYDHLGNTRITHTPINTTGILDLQIDYVADYFPYGKVLREYSSSNGVERYLTTQHERDEETGLDYRGARYYDSDVARFLSVDPMAMKAQNWSPYRYCFDNPVCFIDPNGRFETRKEAREYRREHDIKGRIRKDSDGEGYNISNKYTGQALTKGSQWEIDNGYTDENGIVHSAFELGNKHLDQPKSTLDKSNIVLSTLGLVSDLTEFSWEQASNKKQWEISYDISKRLKSSGYNVKPSALKNGAPKIFKQGGRYLGLAGGAITVGEVLYNGHVKASNVLDGTMTAVAFIPVIGWAASGIYFIADIVTEEVTGKSIGGHLDGTIDNKFGTKDGVITPDFY